jgi:hypothetical protein
MHFYRFPRHRFPRSTFACRGGEDAEFGFGEIKPTAVLGGVVPRNARPGSERSDDPYLSEKPAVLVADTDKDQFVQASNGDIQPKAPLELPAGRYVCFADFSAEGTDNEIFRD